MNVKEELQEIFRDLFEDDTIVLFDEMTAEDIEDWDSLSHMILINNIEAHFKIKFTLDEILSCKNVGAFISLVESKIA